MCGRYSALTEDDIVEMRQIFDELNKKFGYTPASGEVRPTDIAAVFAAGQNGVAPRPVKWGFPHFQGKGVIINARAETAPDKTMFRKPLLHSRCAVPSTGYYEWNHEGKKATDKYHITRPNSKMLYMAGLMNVFHGADGKPYEAFVILTTAPSKSVSQIHDRQPVLLDADELELWCTNDFHIDEVLTRPAPEVELKRVG